MNRRLLRRALFGVGLAWLVADAFLNWLEDDDVFVDGEEGIGVS